MYILILKLTAFCLNANKKFTLRRYEIGWIINVKVYIPFYCGSRTRGGGGEGRGDGETSVSLPKHFLKTYNITLTQLKYTYLSTDSFKLISQFAPRGPGFL